jgi:hypothetical protein
LKFQEVAKPQALKLSLKMAAKTWRQFRFHLRRDFIRNGLEPFTRHTIIVLEQWKEFMKQEVLTPKIGTGKRLTCEPNLAEEHHSAGGFPQSIR